MKDTKKKLLSMLLALCMVLQYVPAMGLAASVEDVYEYQTVPVQADDLPGNDELFAMYVEQQLYGCEWTTFGTAAREELTAVEQAIYDQVKTHIETVAAEGGSTTFVLSDISGLKTEWTAEELGVESIEDTEVVKAQFTAQFDLSRILHALQYDCPYDLYWFDETAGCGMEYAIKRSGQSIDGVPYWTKATIADFTFTYLVNVDYRGSDEYEVTADVARVSAARAKAQAIAADCEAMTDYEKLVAYKNAICDLTSYDDEAVDPETGMWEYGDPWQLINVFDEDTATNVVCEGYAKAFQYLCDLGGLDCISVTGVLSDGTEAEGHMWNIVTLNGKNYLVDVTNCDEGTVGAPDALFMVGNAAGYLADECYAYTIGSQTVTYVYHADVMDFWTWSELELASEDYNPNACDHSYENGFCALCDAYEPCEGEGSAYSPYLIANAGNLYWFMNVVNGGYGDVAQNLNACGKLTADIVVNENVLAADGTLNEGTYRSWTPLGNTDVPYTGDFDGDGFTVSGLYCDISTGYNSSSVGFIGHLELGTVENLTVADSYFAGSEYVGGIVGWSMDGVINNCRNAATVSGRRYIGGVVGEISSACSMLGCINSGVISGTYYAGGVVGLNCGAVNICRNAGTVSGVQYVGGVVGENSGTVTNGRNTGSIEGESLVGGIAGRNSDFSAATDCDNNGTISGNDSVGGIVGMNTGAVRNCCNGGEIIADHSAGGIVGMNYKIDTGEEYADPLVASCYNTGAVTANSGYSAVVGSTSGSCEVTNCYYLDTAETDSLDGTTFKTIDQFTYGEVAHLLGQGWGQTIGIDALPILGGEHVYQVTKCTGTGIGYSNLEYCVAHRISMVAAVDATCTQDGNTMYWSCSDCGKFFLEYTGYTELTDNSWIIPALGHTEETIPGTVTCTEPGLSDGVVCSVCGEVLVEQTEVPAGHRFEVCKGTDPTCTEDGLEGYACVRCWDTAVEYIVVVPALGHSLEDGVCTVCGLACAVQNSATGAYYASVAEALKAAEAGQTVQLQADCTESDIMVYPGVTLDLNGYHLTVDYIVGFDSADVIDSAGAGRLITGEKSAVLDEANAMVPVYDGTGYVFTQVGFALSQDTTYKGEGIKINAGAYPVRMDVVELLKDGCADNNIQIVLLLSWDTQQGTGKQEFVFTDEVAAEVYSSNDGSWYNYSKMFSMVITGFEQIQNLTARMVIVSGTDVEYVSSNSVTIG